MKRSHQDFNDLSPTTSQKKKRRQESKDQEEEKLKKKRERSLEQQMPDECCREEKRRRDESDKGAAGPMKAQAQPSRLNPLSISSYNFYSKLGAGAFAKVMLAKLGGKKPYVAVKSILKTEKTKYENLLTEAHILKISRDSPFLCQGYAAFQTQRHAFFVMEYLSGGSLEDELEQHGSLPIDRVKFHSAEVICGLQFLHGDGIIHRDIKPMNILLDHQGHTKISDFGLAKENISPGDTTTGWAGTLVYMAPEILHKGSYNAAVDWWSFGITICDLATGNIPFNNSSKTKLINSIKFHDPKIPDELDKDLKDLLRRLLKRKPKRRLGLRGDIRSHPFYQSINWVVLEEEGLQPPFQPITPADKLFQPYDGKRPLSFLNEEEATPGDRNIVPGYSFLNSSWLE
ncbi:protein kinase C delta type [Xenopus laevis]|uniref:Protein kinase domain-containing protein n=2 Tax=Xenopus laevis TaxID=8355 RepID=A0A974CEG8_XENLA|nr:protein kinase C delta type [Xenopus laevis]OCT71722.1 hypothetical protein XELAEV_18034700mg [Xenopus laevis]